MCCNILPNQRRGNPQYLRYLHRPVDGQALSQHGENKRRLWSTPLLLHAGGISCSSFAFQSVQVDVQVDGHLKWHSASSSNIRIFRQVRCDRETSDSYDITGCYQAEMVEKLRWLLGAL